jgi:hypothetical protein
LRKVRKAENKTTVRDIGKMQCNALHISIRIVPEKFPNKSSYSRKAP